MAFNASLIYDKYIDIMIPCDEIFSKLTSYFYLIEFFLGQNYRFMEDNKFKSSPAAPAYEIWSNCIPPPILDDILSIILKQTYCQKKFVILLNKMAEIMMGRSAFPT